MEEDANGEEYAKQEERSGQSASRAEESQALRHELRPRGPVRFDMSVTESPGSVRLEIRGELDVLTTPRLAAELNSVLRRLSTDVVVDLRQTESIDSAGLQILLGTQRRLSQASRNLTVVCDDGPVRRVIELTRLSEVLGLTRGDARPPNSL